MEQIKKIEHEKILKKTAWFITSQRCIHRSPTKIQKKHNEWCIGVLFFRASVEWWIISHWAED